MLIYATLYKECMCNCMSVAVVLTNKKLCVECMAETVSCMLLILVHMPNPLVANSTWHK